MQLSPERLPNHLAQGLAPIYLIHGEEPLQVGESLDAVRSTAKERGYDERLVFDVERGFDWSTLRREAQSLSLFGANRLIEVRMPTGKPGDDGARKLREYAADPVPGVLLLLSTGKLETKIQRSAWFKALDGAGVTVQARQIERKRLPGWIQQRARGKGLELSEGGAELLADRVEGNLLACAQEIDKLALLFPDQNLNAEAVQSAVSDSARYSLFALIDSALAGDAVRTLRILRGLRAEGTEPPLVIWALARELRLLNRMAHGLLRKQKLADLLSENRVWASRKALISGTLKRHDPEALREMLSRLGAVDRIIKGDARGNPWDELALILLGLAGVQFARGNVTDYA